MSGDSSSLLSRLLGSSWEASYPSDRAPSAGRYEVLPEANEANEVLEAAAAARAAARRSRRSRVRRTLLLGTAVLATAGLAVVASRQTDGLAYQLAEAGRLEPCGFNIILLRHCNKKPVWSKHATPPGYCTQEGFARGEHLPHLFGLGKRFPTPTRLIGRKLPKGEYVSRDLYVLWPIAQKFGLKVEANYAVDQVLQFTRSLNNEKRHLCGATIVVSWDHCGIPAIAQALGCTADACRTCWDDDDYDSVLWLRMSESGSSWNVSVNVSHEGFGGPDGPSSYRECQGNPAENENFGFTCRWRPTNQTHM